MFKDESGGDQIIEFVGLRAKLYSYLMDDGKEEKKAKGIRKSVIKRTISYEDYKTCLFNLQIQMRKMIVIHSHLHEIYSETIHKVALSPFDDKRIPRKSTYAIRHYRAIENNYNHNQV